MFAFGISVKSLALVGSSRKGEVLHGMNAKSLVPPISDLGHVAASHALLVNNNSKHGSI
jgi:hypothetical protein